MGSKTLGELCSFNRGASVPRARMHEQGDYLYIHYGDLYKGFELRIDVDAPQKPIPYITSDERIKDGQWLHDQDIVYVLTSETVDDLGHSFLFNNPCDVPAVAGTETTVVRVERQDLLSPAYLNYLMHTPRFKLLLRQYVKGMKVFRVHPDDLARIEVELPTLDNQKKIVSLLNTIFEQQMIARRTNDYLLEVGDAVFSNALTANGSSVVYRAIDQYCTVKGGKRLPKGSNLTDTANSHPYIRVRDLNDSSVLLLTPDMMYVDDEIQAGIARYIVEEGDVIISVVGTIGLTAYIGDSLHQANLTENCNRLTAFQGDEAAWTYYFLRSAAGQDAIRQGTVGAVQAKLPLKNIKAIEVPFPTGEVYIEAEQVLSGTLKTIQANFKESIVLAELRDTLLPKLMSGEVDVSEVELPIPPNNHLYED